ncbi:POSSIBLE LINOLEOYL-CoA DESATURASE (DELTA(6)-DESATURASE) [hydrothermal vent metagenome]|uniref:POSSIBLE LINOLEOYL-CoA DESATURASE (DELTA(6)-DESATURASE) n=1 Tax=hydrothermal vent metagenome TaxID=652676 RepID=A0A1W1CR54_9ZZZZ
MESKPEEIEKLEVVKDNQPKYARYEDIDKEQLEKDINAIKETMEPVGEEDFQHLLKMQRWGRMFTFGGYGIILLLSIMGLGGELSSVVFWPLALLAAIGISTGNVARWANVTHPVLHGAYDKVPNIPEKYTKKVFAKGARRYIDWLDWIKPEAWSYEHNIMHHYHLGEADDPDNVERNLQWLIQSKIPMFIRYMMMYAFAGMWKFLYYAPNTLRILENKRLKEADKRTITDYQLDPRTKNGLELWMEYLLPYIIIKFIVFPVLFLPFGAQASINALIIILIAELFANLHSFLVIVPNHSAEDIYMFNEPHKSTGEFYLRQIMGSVNYNTGTDFLDFVHGFLNYQVEHHLFPNMPLSYYQKMQPIVKDICKKHNLEYRQESVWKRIHMTIDLMVGKTQLLRVDGI